MLPMFVAQLGIFIVKGIIYFFFPLKAVTDITTQTEVEAAERAAAMARRAAHVQIGGARSKLSTEAMVLGTAIIAIVGGGALKAVVDSLVAE